MDKASTPLLEKVSLTSTTPTPPPPSAKPTPKLSKTSIRLIALTALSLYTYRALSYPSLTQIGDAAHGAVDIGYGLVTGGGLSGVGMGREEVRMLKEGECPVQPEAIGKGEWNVPDNFTDVVIGRLSRSVQYPAESFDDMGPVGEDKRWDAHYAFDEFLEREFPLIYSTLTHTPINTHAHLYTLPGLNPSLQPILLMAHQDVVPVNPATIRQWTFPPFEGRVDGGWVWGRGSADCKNQLLGIMSALTKLLEEGFESERTILIGIGFDEEIGGKQGAHLISSHLQDLYGPSSLAFLVDEGFGGVDEAYGRRFASLGMAEKGSVNFKVTVDTPGGHSSVPPEHTGIGILAQLLVHLESHPFPTSLHPANPYLKYLNCLADYAPKLPHSLRKAIKSPRKWEKLAKELSKDAKERALLGTTMAVDLISGGVKVNALPERAEATINHRIAFTSSVAETQEHVVKILKRITHDLDIDFTAFNQSYPAKHSHNRKVTLEIGGERGLEPAPITPSEGDVFELIGGTVREVFGKDVVVAPSGMYANTDTKSYWNLTRNLYRFIPAPIAEFKNAHTVDERVSVNAHLSTIRFFYQLLQNVQGWRHGSEK